MSDSSRFSENFDRARESLAQKTSSGMSLNSPPPLKGDGNGVYRVHIVGNRGSDKSTTWRIDVIAYLAHLSRRYRKGEYEHSRW